MTGFKKARLLTGIEQTHLSGDDLVAYLASNSNLPGPRGNIELAYAFADFVESHYLDEPSLFDLCRKMLAISSEEAPTNDPREIVPFCAAVALGRIARADAKMTERILLLLHAASYDSRWRLREGVAMALQEFLSDEFIDRLALLDQWINSDNPLVIRALLAGVAEPRLLRTEVAAEAALSLHQKVIGRICTNEFSKSREREILVKGLCYTVSVVVAAIPDRGFAFMESLSEEKNPYIRKILKENLKKKRLERLDKERVAKILELIRATAT